MLKLAVAHTTAGLNTQVVSTIKQAIDHEKLPMVTFIKIDKGESNLQDIYLRMKEKKSEVAVVCECMQEVGFVTIKDISQSLLNSYIPTNPAMPNSNSMLQRESLRLSFNSNQNQSIEERTSQLYRLLESKMDFLAFED